MRTLKFFALVGIFLASNAPNRLAARNHQTVNNGEPHYVVIGAFAIEKNAMKFASYAKKQRYDARFQLNPSRHLYYVYVLNTEDRDLAIREAQRLREETEFTDAWVFAGILGSAPAVSNEDLHPYTEKSMETIPSDPNANADQVASTTANAARLTAAPADNEAAGKKFVFEVFRASDNEKVEGDVYLIDADKNQKLATYEGNKTVRIFEPANQSGNLILICDVFGYRKLQRGINFDDPQGEGVRVDEEGNIVVPFDLIRLKKGDVAIMYNVYFFKDAAVMRPESRFEVNSLVDMLNENKKYRIKIHGHTNGGAPGKIITKEGDNFFSLTGTKEGFGSAKELSEQRAKVIRDYLASSGIDEKRMEIKAWGGKKPLHDKHSSRAQENVRVEIEILED